EIIELANKIGTFDISIKPQEDCCTLFVPKHQTAKGDLKVVKDLEKKLNSAKLVKEILKSKDLTIVYA
ncbi:MAG: tRNA 4-thiouridine(8) synthase ThiI, partial [Nanoarchaeota archaeon]|nr:tRNA 4-thiouridine(8) synthase ThiI [Nanoarchaeota archaeon]